MIGNVHLIGSSALLTNELGMVDLVDEWLDSYYGSEIKESGFVDLDKINPFCEVLDVLFPDCPEVELSSFLFCWYEALNAICSYPASILPYFEIYYLGIQIYRRLLASPFKADPSVLTYILIHEEELAYLDSESKKDFEDTYFIPLDAYASRTLDFVRSYFQGGCIDKHVLEDNLSLSLLVLYAFYHKNRSIFDSCLDIYKIHIKEDLSNSSANNS